MLGAIAGDIIGSVHEGVGTKTRDFPLFTPRSTFTDDSVLSVAVADTMAGGIAEAYFSGLSEEMKRQTLARLDEPLRRMVEHFQARYGL